MGGAKLVWLYRVDYGAHLSVTGDVVDAINRLKIMRLILSAMVKLEEGGILQREHGKCRHQGIWNRDLGVPDASFSDFDKGIADGSKESIGVQMLSYRSAEQLVALYSVLSAKLALSHGSIAY